MTPERFNEIWWITNGPLASKGLRHERQMMKELCDYINELHLCYGIGEEEIVQPAMPGGDYLRDIED